MFFRQFHNDALGCCSYLIASAATSEAAIVDPAQNIAQYEAVLAQRHFRLRYVIDTHIHADHISGARRLAAAHGAELCLHERAQVAYPTRPVRDGEELTLGQLRLRILHTPGHRGELISIAVLDRDRGNEPFMLLTGDSLLVGDAGRPDFNGGDPFAQYDSVQRLLNLPEWMAVFPGHFEGPCGAAMYGAPSTTIGAERRFNHLAMLGRDDFVQELTSTIPPRPLNMTAIEATNRGHADVQWAMLQDAPEVNQITAESLADRLADVFLLDVREPAEFQAAHVGGAVNIPQADLATRLTEVPRDQPIVCICQAGRRSLKAAHFLMQVGFTDVANVLGGTSAWVEAGQPAEAYRELELLLASAAAD